ncbi:MAG TPA: PTS sugar transporter subunit IIC [Candidatus Sulfomarinibacteraceae bacterium]|nr:PTS sugar transporter subunit IIC [Candidatus Sulfomarinibacteraceae bacterium]
MQRMTASPRAIRLAALVTTALFGALLFAGPTFAAEGDEPTADLFRAALVGIGYYLSNSPWLLGIGGFFGLYRPLVAGLIVGIIFGDPVKGAEIGAAINLLYIGFISAGGSIPADPSVAGWVGTALAMASDVSPETAISLGVAIGLLGTIIFFTRMSVDAVFAHWADARAEAGDIAGVARMNWLPPQIFLFVISFFPATIAVWAGASVVGDWIGWLGANAPWILRGFEIAGGLLPAIGIAMNMRFIFRGGVIPYYFLGYIMASASAGGLNIVAIAIVGAALAVLHVTLMRQPSMRAGEA